MDRKHILTSVNICFGPMSKNIVDSIIEYSNIKNVNIVFIPSRRQIEWYGGYVNNWTTKDFAEYVYSKSKNIAIQRDHGGPGQGLDDDDGYKSLYFDCLYFDSIHIDPWKKYCNLTDGINHTIELIKYCYNINNNIYFEIGTEEAIRSFTVEELEIFISKVREGLNVNLYNRIIFCVLQSGTALENGENIGIYNSNKLIQMVDIIKKYGLLTKEHNGDFMENDIRIDRLKNGLDCINIAPQLGTFETNVILHNVNHSDFLSIYNLCIDSGKWKKWVNFNPDNNKRKIVEISCHYIFSNNEFNLIKTKISNIDKNIIEQLFIFLNNFYV